MNRRTFLQRQSERGADRWPLVASDVLAQTPPRLGTRRRAAPAAPPAAAARPRKLVLDANSRSLQWLRTADEVGEGDDRDGVRRRVPARPAVSGPHRSGAGRAGAAGVRQNRCAATDCGSRRSKARRSRIVTEPNAEAIIGAAAQAGVTHYSLGGYTYDLKKPLAPQLDAIKLRLERFVRFNEKHEDQARVPHGRRARTPSAASCSICCR